MIPANVVPLVSYIGNDTEDEFAFDFSTFESGNVKARVKSPAGIYTDLVLATDYTLDGIGRLAGGGSLTLVDAGQAWLAAGKLATGYTLFIQYTPQAKQLARFRDLGPHAPVAFERALDRLTMDIVALLNADGSVTDAATFLDYGYTPSGPQTIAAGEAIVVQKLLRQHIRVQSDGGEVALSATPFGNDPDLFEDGMEIVIEPVSDADYLTLAENAAAYGFEGNGGIVLKRKRIITFIYSAYAQRFYAKATGVW